MILLPVASVTARAPWAITTIASCLPVLVLAMGTALAHMRRDDALTTRTADPRLWPGPAHCLAESERTV